jgi:hypothetical protein
VGPRAVLDAVLKRTKDDSSLRHVTLPKTIVSKSSESCSPGSLYLLQVNRLDLFHIECSGKTNEVHITYRLKMLSV